MSRSATFLLAASMMACGVSPQTTSPTTPGVPSAEPPSSPTNTTTSLRPVRSTKATVGTVAKVVVNRTSPVDSPLFVFDPAVDGNNVITCSTTGTECAAFVATEPTVHCALDATYGSVCVVTRQKTSLFYVENYTPNTNGLVSFPIPCDDASYSAEIYGADQTTHAIVDAQKAPPFKFDASCAGVAPTFSDLQQPSLVFPTIYAGTFPPPYDRYTMTVQNSGYPWANSFSMTCGTATQNTTSGSVTFATPPAGSSTVTCAATFQLDRSLLKSTEIATPWTLKVQPPAWPTVGSVIVTGP